MTVVDFYLGLGSRYSYLAASQVDRLEMQYGCRFAWKPIASGALIDRRGDHPFRHQDGMGQYDRSYRQYDASAWAAHYGIPFNEPTAVKVDADGPALAGLAAERQGALVACCRHLFAMIFAEGAPIDEVAIDALPQRLGLDRTAFRRDLESPDTRARHEALIDEAAARGAFGVPTFFLDGRLFWGNDRLPLLEAALRGANLPRWRST
ncbi:MAG: 2-hydroxychromene-2-carboxylate isomerase [Reyranellales bacterium]